MTIASVGNQSGILGNLVGGVPVGVQAWVQDVNSRGGINGHPVKYLIADDGGDPSRHLALVKQMVEEKGVIAFVGQNAALTGQSSVGYINQERVPVIGMDGACSWCYGDGGAMFFPQSSQSGGLVPSVVGSLAKLYPDKKKIGVVSCVEAQGCRDFHEGLPAAAKQFGLNMVWRGQVSLGQPDYTAECVSARNAGADMVVMAFDTNSMVRFARSCNSISYKPTWGAPHSVLDELKKEPLLNGMVVESPIAPWFTANTPAAQAFERTWQKYGSGNDRNVMNGMGWVSAKIFERATQALPEPPTSQAILAGLWTINNDDLGGLAPPLTFVKDKPVAQRSCWWAVQTDNGKWADRSGGRVTCLN